MVANVTAHTTLAQAQVHAKVSELQTVCDCRTKVLGTDHEPSIIDAEVCQHLRTRCIPTRDRGLVLMHEQPPLQLMGCLRAIDREAGKACHKHESICNRVCGVLWMLVATRASALKGVTGGQRQAERAKGATAGQSLKNRSQIGSVAFKGEAQISGATAAPQKRPAKLPCALAWHLALV